MTYTILSAVYANKERAAITLQTKEAGAVSICEADAPTIWADVIAAGKIGDYVEPV